MPRSAHGWCLASLVVAALIQVVAPVSASAHAIGYLIVAIWAMVLAVAGVRRNRPERPLGWWLVVAGFMGWVAADVVWTVEQLGFEVQTYPVPSDAVYIASYLLVVAGLLVMMRTQRLYGRVSGILDASIIAVGSSIFVSAAVLLPLVDDSSLTTSAKVVSAAYPVLDVVLLVTAGHLWITPGARSRSYTLLLLSLVAAFVPDITWTAVSFASGQTIPAVITDAGWLLVYVLLAFATADPSMRRLGQPNPASESSVASRRRLTLLAVGLLMPAAALFVPRYGNYTDGVPVLGLSAFVLAILTLVRMSSLLGVIQAQSVQLAALASRDALTGAPNRRTWDHELSAACRAAQENGTPLTIALIDLDRFKRFNDAHGHPAVDRLLREAVAGWNDVIGDQGLLARYGGEEFALLLPKTTREEGLALVSAMRSMTPSGQTFSAGVAAWVPGTEPTMALADADRGLYHAKRAGRDRVVGFPLADTSRPSEQLTPSMVFQPIVDLETGAVVAYEALSRFGGRTPQGVFQLASEGGWGDILEADAINAALGVPERPPVPLHVNASAAALQSERFWRMLPADLAGVVVEISEPYGAAELAELDAVVRRVRSRGGAVAIDDLGSGSQELLRLATLEPDVVKVDRGLVEGCADDPGRQAVLRAAREFTRSLGSRLYVEGVTDRRDIEQLRALGVRYAQGFGVAPPAAAWGAERVGVGRDRQPA
jgi:diguanylate cyclase (GGDEF)-like protein